MPASRIPFILEDLWDEIARLSPGATITITLESFAYDHVARELSHHSGIPNGPSTEMIYSGIKLVRASAPAECLKPEEE